MAKLTEIEVKNILKNKDSMIGSLHNRMYAIRMDLHRGHEMMEMVRLPSSKINDMPGRKGDYSGLEDIYVRYEESLERRNKEYKALFRQLIREEERINRVWAAFHSLDDRYYGILHNLYVKNGLYKTVEVESGLSHRIFEETRKEGIDQIIAMAESEKSIELLMLMKKEKHQKDTQKPEKKDWEQITLTEFLGDEKQ